MCFIIDPKHPEKKIAKRDITCYKVLNSLATSIYQLKPYELGVLYKQKMEDPIKKGLGDAKINIGFHSYSNIKRANLIVLLIGNYVYKTIIPKGSEYYYNSMRNEYVSNQIIIKEKL